MLAVLRQNIYYTGARRESTRKHANANIPEINTCLALWMQTIKGQFKVKGRGMGHYLMDQYVIIQSLKVPGSLLPVWGLYVVLCVGFLRVLRLLPTDQTRAVRLISEV